MAIDIAKMKQTALRLIKENGTKCVLKNPKGELVYDIQLNEYVQEYDTYQGYCIISTYEDRLVDGTVIKFGDRRVTAILPAEPMPGISILEIYNKTGNVTKRVPHNTVFYPTGDGTYSDPMLEGMYPHDSMSPHSRITVTEPQAVYHVINFAPVNPNGGTSILTKLQCRK